jgi:hypothetical protein
MVATARRLCRGFVLVSLFLSEPRPRGSGGLKGSHGTPFVPWVCSCQFVLVRAATARERWLCFIRSESGIWNSEFEEPYPNIEMSHWLMANEHVSNCYALEGHSVSSRRFQSAERRHQPAERRHDEKPTPKGLNVKAGGNAPGSMQLRKMYRTAVGRRGALAQRLKIVWG